MGAEAVTVPLAFLAGLVSFVSPCCLPLIPTYVSILAGGRPRAEGKRFGAGWVTQAGPGTERAAVMARAVAFVLGFSAVFVALGLSASALGQLLLGNQVLLRRVGGTAVVLFGLHLLGWLPIPALGRDTRPNYRPGQVGVASSFGLGVAFSAGWSPCVGPILASILVLAGTGQASGPLLLSAYALGLALPFLATAWWLDAVLVRLKWLRQKARAIELASGALLVVVGVMVYNNAFLKLASYFRWGF